ncbi:MAG: hypothetical protein D5S00_09035 [Tindallia sp. MSAO_Bac2]|nr:MAG: hypothetical protein D5S00_09035 [Tindallia sp. MSAO_Bac2]
MKRIINNQQGSALAFTLIVILVLAILGASILTTAVADTRNVIYQENSMKSYYLARSGALTLAETITTDSSIDVTELIDKTADTISIADGEVSVHVSDNDDDLIISSVGSFQNASQQVDVILREEASQAFDYTIFANGSINVHNNITIHGQVATNAQYVNDNNPYSAGNGTYPKPDEVKFDAKIPMPVIEIPTSYDAEYDDMVMSDSVSSGGDKHVLFRNGFYLDNHEEFMVTGDGTYHMYIENGISLDNHSFIRSDSDVNIFIYVIDDSTVLIDGAYVEAMLIAPDSHVRFHKSGANKFNGRSFHGTIIADSVEIHGNKSDFDPDSDSDPDDASVEKEYRIHEIR